MYIFLCVVCSHISPYACIIQKHRFLTSWGFRCLWSKMLILETKLRPAVKTVGVLSNWGISPALCLISFKTMLAFIEIILLNLIFSLLMLEKISSSHMSHTNINYVSKWHMHNLIWVKLKDFFLYTVSEHEYVL